MNNLKLNKLQMNTNTSKCSVDIKKFAAFESTIVSNNLSRNA